MTLDDWLARIYKADLRGNREAEVAELTDATNEDPALLASAQTRLTELDALIAARTEQACAYSTKYRVYLKEVLGS